MSRIRFASVVGAAAIALVALSGIASGATLTWSAPQLIDRSLPLAHSQQIVGVSCPSRRLCVAVDDGGSLLSSLSPLDPRSWVVKHVVNASFAGLSCPTVHFCAAVDDRGQVVSSTHPSTGGWSVEAVDRAEVDRNNRLSFEDISCASASFCAATDWFGDVLTSTHPTGGGGEWRRVALGMGGEPDFTNGAEISCPSQKLCVIAASGRVLVSVKPRGPKHAWHSAALAGAASVSCPSARICAVSSARRVWVSKRPAAGAATWRLSLSSHGLQRVSCGSSGWCTVTALGGVLASTAPAARHPTWRFTAIKHEHLDGFSCLSRSLCVAGDTGGGILSSRDPRKGFTAFGVDGFDSLTRISCPTEGLCVASDDGGNIGWSTGAGWSFAHVLPDSGPYGGGALALSCASPSLCAAVDQNRQLRVSTSPTGGPATWRVTNLAPCRPLCDPSVSPTSTGALIAVSCTVGPLCVAIAPDGRVFSSTNPAGGVHAWRKVVLNTSVGGSPEAIGCSISVCVIDGSEGPVFVSSNPTGPASAWVPAALPPAAVPGAAPGPPWCGPGSLCVAPIADGLVSSANPAAAGASWRATTPFDNGHDVKGISCGSPTLCVAVDDAGSAFVSSDPMGDASAWTGQVIDPGISINAVSCASATSCWAVASDGTAEHGTS